MRWLNNMSETIKRGIRSWLNVVPASGNCIQINLRSTRLSRASTAKMHNYSCIYATFTCFILYIFYKSFIKLKFPRVI